MPVEVRFPGPLQALANGARSVTADGPTVGEVIGDVGHRFPGLTERILDSNGELHRFVNIYLNDEDVRFLGGLSAPVHSGDVVAILPALAGG